MTPSSAAQSPLAADSAEGKKPPGPELLDRLLVGGGDVPGRVHADGPRGLAEPLERLAKQAREGRESRRVAADDRKHQREAVAGGADDRLGAAADADPNRERAVLGVRDDVLVAQRRASGSSPGDRAAVHQLGDRLVFSSNSRS
jgi:hypothetical protein